MCQNSRHSRLTPLVGMSDNDIMKEVPAIDIETIIEKAGGVPRLMALLGVARTTVLDWRRTGFIPANRVGQISDALKLPLEVVQKLAQGPKTRSRPSGATKPDAKPKPSPKRSRTPGTTGEARNAA